MQEPRRLPIDTAMRAMETRAAAAASATRDSHGRKQVEACKTQPCAEELAREQGRVQEKKEKESRQKRRQQTRRRREAEEKKKPSISAWPVCGLAWQAWPA